MQRIGRISVSLLRERLPAHARASLAATLLAVGHAPLALALFELGDLVEAARCARAEEEAQPGACAAPVTTLELLRALEQGADLAAPG